MQLPIREHYFAVKSYVDENGKNVWSLVEFDEFPSRPEVIRVVEAESINFVDMTDMDSIRDINMQYELMRMFKEKNGEESAG